MDIAHSIGLIPRAVKLPLEGLAGLQLPAVLHWGMNHYVVLESVERGQALIHNPDGRSGRMPISEVSKYFTGVALELRPSDDFEIGEHRETLKLRQLWRRITGMKRAAGQVVILSLSLQLFALVSPFFVQLAIDKALPSFDFHLLTILGLGFLLLALVNAGAMLLRSLVLLAAGSSLGFGVTTNLARRLFRLPIAWFERRHTGDILSRFQSVAPIQTMLTQGAIAAVIDGAMALLTLIAMFYYSALLTSVAIVSFLLYGLVRAISFSHERRAQEAAIVTQGKEQTMLIETLRGMTTLRLFGREMLRHALWQTKYADVVNANASVARVRIWQATSNMLILGFENVVTVWLAIGLVMTNSGFSIGMIFAYVAFKAQFMQKTAALIDQAIAFKMLGLHLERLSDIALTAEDKSFSDTTNVEVALGGRIEVRNVHYRYAPSDPLVLRGVDLVVEPGEHVAITGPSGGGKSTLVKLILGLVEPEQGVVLVDGRPLGEFGYKNFHRQVAAVLQEDSLFAGSLAENIALFEEGVDMERVISASEAASIHDDIMCMPMQYETFVGDMGSTLSGGQKQRVILARALYRCPKLLIMDEGTAHLDVEHERAVNRAIKATGATLIVVAHRSETIRAATRVLAMINGRLQSVSEPN